MALHASLPSRSVLLRLLSGLVILFLAHLPVTVAYPLPPLSIARYDLKGAGALDWVAFAGGKVPSLAPLRNPLDVPTNAVDWYKMSSSLNQGQPLFSTSLNATMSDHIAVATVRTNGLAVFMFGTGYVDGVLSDQLEVWTADDSNNSPRRTGFVRLPDTHGPVAKACAAALGPGLVAIAGGILGSGQPSSVVTIFNVTDLTTRVFTDPNFAITDTACSGFGLRFVLAGGRFANGSLSTVAHLFTAVAGLNVAYELVPLPGGRYAHAVGLSSTSIVIAGGYTTENTAADAINVINIDGMSSGAVLINTQREYPVGTCGAYDCVFAGGNEISTGRSCFDADVVGSSPLLLPNWSYTSSLAQAVSGAAIARTDSHVIVVAGGLDNTGTSTNVTAQVETFGGTVRQRVLHLTRPRSSLAAVAVSDVIALIAGGENASGAVLGDVDIYNATTHTITPHPTGLALPRSQLCAAATRGIALFAGGFGTNSLLDSVEAYNVSTGLFSSFGSLQEARVSISCAGVDSVVIFSGGRTLTGFSASVDVYDVITGAHSYRGGSLGRALQAAVASLDLNGLCFAANPTAEVLCYDITGNAIASQYTLARPTASATGVILRKQCILTFGGLAYTNGSLVTYHALQLMQPGNLTLPMTMRSLSQTVAHAVGEKAIAAGGFAHFLRACTYTAASSSSDQDIAADMTIVDRGYRTVNSLAVARRSHAGAGLRALGGVWIFAGGTDGINPLSTVEAFADRWLLGAVSPTPTVTVSLMSSCIGAAPLPGALCVQGVTPTVIIVTTGQQVIVNGTLVLLPISVTQITSDGVTAPITVTGSITLDGVLTLVLPTEATSGDLIPIITGSGEINGSFTEIGVVSPKKCQKVTGSAEVASSAYSVLLDVNNSACKSRGLGGGVIAAIVMGVIVAVVLIALSMLLIYSRLNPKSKLFRKQKKAYGAAESEGVYTFN